MDPTRHQEATPAATVARARRLWELGAFTRARDLLVHADPDAPEALLARADYHLHTADLGPALAAYRAAEPRLPEPYQRVHALRGQAGALLNLDLPAEALAIAERALGLAMGADTSDHERANVMTMQAGALGLLAQRGSFWTKLRHGPSVRAGFERALQLDPTNAFARTGLGRFLLLAPAVLGHDPARALIELEHALTRAPFYYLTHAWYIRALEANAAWGEARRQRDLYAERYGAFPGALAELAAGA